MTASAQTRALETCNGESVFDSAQAYYGAGVFSTTSAGVDPFVRPNRSEFTRFGSQWRPRRKSRGHLRKHESPTATRSGPTSRQRAAAAIHDEEHVEAGGRDVCVRWPLHRHYLHRSVGCRVGKSGSNTLVPGPGPVREFGEFATSGRLPERGVKPLVFLMACDLQNSLRLSSSMVTGPSLTICTFIFA